MSELNITNCKRNFCFLSSCWQYQIPGNSLEWFSCQLSEIMLSGLTQLSLIAGCFSNPAEENLGMWNECEEYCERRARFCVQNCVNSSQRSSGQTKQKLPKVCVGERARETESESVCACAPAHVSVWVCARICLSGNCSSLHPEPKTVLFLGCSLVMTLNVPLDLTDSWETNIRSDQLSSCFLQTGDCYRNLLVYR